MRLELRGLGRINKIQDILQTGGYQKYRLDQILSNIFKKNNKTFREMEDIPKPLRLDLKKGFPDGILSLKPFKNFKDKQGVTVWFKTTDGLAIYSHMTITPCNSVLNLSSQVGCAFSCKSCPSGIKGFSRQLTADEIIDQILYFLQTGYKFDSIYFSGMGEPLGNPYLFDALDIINSSNYLNISSRRIRISTIGILPGLKKLNNEFPQINLDFSLNNPLSDERSSMIPINKVYPFEEVLDLLDQRIEKAKRRICINYMLIPGLNNTKAHARALVDLVKSRRTEIQHLYYLRLFPRVGGTESELESDNLANEFFEAILRKNRINLASGNVIRNTIYRMIELNNDFKNI